MVVLRVAFRLGGTSNEIPVIREPNRWRTSASQVALESISTYIDWLLGSHSDTFGPIWVLERVDFVFPKWSLTRLWWTQDLTTMFLMRRVVAHMGWEHVQKARPAVITDCLR